MSYLREHDDEASCNGLSDTDRKHNTPSESPLEDVNAVLHTIPTVTITKTNKLIHSTATVILEILGFKMNSTGHKEQYPLLRRWLQA